MRSFKPNHYRPVALDLIVCFGAVRLAWRRGHESRLWVDLARTVSAARMAGIGAKRQPFFCNRELPVLLPVRTFAFSPCQSEKDVRYSTMSALKPLTKPRTAARSPAGTSKAVSVDSI